MAACSAPGLGRVGLCGHRRKRASCGISWLVSDIFERDGIDIDRSTLALGTGKTATARLWVCGRDEGSWGSSIPPASWHQFSPDRKGQQPQDHLARYRGWMHADGYAGSEDLYRSGDIHEGACMAHIRRKFADIHRAQGSAITDEAI
nr:transposase [Pseudorhodobacter aquimaris]